MQYNGYKYAVKKPLRGTFGNETKGLVNYYRDLSKNIGSKSMLKLLDEHGHINNFKVLNKKGKYCKELAPLRLANSNSDEFVYKLMEAFANYSFDDDGEESQKILDKLISIVIDAQDDDGYLNTYYQIKKMPHFAETNRCEFLDVGHLMTAATAYYRLKGNDSLIETVCKFADLVIEKFGYPNHLPYVQHGQIYQQFEHPEHEMAFIELYRATGRKKYLDFALQTLNEYKYWDFKNNFGHSVAIENLNASAVDAFLETGESKMLDVCQKMWDDLTLTKMYITGGIGSHFLSECIGSRYDLPNQRAYAETCAGVIGFIHAYKMLLATGKSSFADYMEHILYNAVLVGYSPTGDRYFYINPLKYDPYDIHLPEEKFSPTGHGTQAMGDSQNRTLRWVWNNCPCCPPNLHRLLASMGDYIYTKDHNDISVELYISSNLQINNDLSLKMETMYPLNGDVKITIIGNGNTKIKLRIPNWCSDFDIQINDFKAKYDLEKGYAVIDRKWNNNDQLILSMKMNTRIVTGHPDSQNANSGAILRGPILYCLEETDNTDTDIFAVRLKRISKFTEKNIEISGVNSVMLNTSCNISDITLWNNAPYIPLDNELRNNQNSGINAIPYFLWSNRGIKKMTVWIPFSF